MTINDKLNNFLKNHEKNAYRRALYSVHNEEAAYDIVQDSMLKLVENYSDKDHKELLFLFQRILSNNIIDWFRKQKSQGSVIKYINEFDVEDEEGFIESIEYDNNIDIPYANENQKDILNAIDKAITQLPLRQKEAFMLRYIEELTVTETAEVMNCSEGSVKTHTSRAVASLSAILLKQGISLND